MRGIGMTPIGSMPQRVAAVSTRARGIMVIMPAPDVTIHLGDTCDGGSNLAPIICRRWRGGKACGRDDRSDDDGDEREAHGLSFQVRSIGVPRPVFTIIRDILNAVPCWLSQVRSSFIVFGDGPLSGHGLSRRFDAPGARRIQREPKPSDPVNCETSAPIFIAPDDMIEVKHGSVLGSDVKSVALGGVRRDPD